jgi:hypothetical protein
MKDWDPATHMNKQDWRRTCQRVSQDRVKFLLDQAKKDSGKKEIEPRWEHQDRGAAPPSSLCRGCSV